MKLDDVALTLLAALVERQGYTPGAEEDLASDAFKLAKGFLAVREQHIHASGVTPSIR